MRKRNLVATVMALILPLTVTPAVSATPTAEAKTASASVTTETDTLSPDVEHALQFLSYNKNSGQLEYDESGARAASVEGNYIANLVAFSGILDSQQTDVFLGAIDAPTPDESEHTIRPMALPLILIPILKIVGTGAASAIVASVTKWGISGACSQLRGQFGAFDSFCRANGWQ